MRCLSPYGRYMLQLFEAEEQVVVDARGFANTTVLKKPIMAQFETSGVLDHEIEVALTHFNFTGLPDGVSPLTHIGVFDTEAFVEQYPEKGRGDTPGRSEMQRQIEDRLREILETGAATGEYVIVDLPKAPKPWNSYDKDSVEDIIKFQERLQVDPEEILRYEQENEQRAELIENMLRKTDPEGADREFGPEGEVVAEVQA